LGRSPDRVAGSAVNALGICLYHHRDLGLSATSKRVPPPRLAPDQGEGAGPCGQSRLPLGARRRRARASEHTPVPSVGCHVPPLPGRTARLVETATRDREAPVPRLSEQGTTKNLSELRKLRNALQRRPELDRVNGMSSPTSRVSVFGSSDLLDAVGPHLFEGADALDIGVGVSAREPAQKRSHLPAARRTRRLRASPASGR
jgi:hypothetical protein